MNRNYDIVREACIKANPELIEDIPVLFHKDSKWCYSYVDEAGINRHSDAFPSREAAIEGAMLSGRCSIRTIRLADVLLTLGLENFHNNDKIPELIYGYRHSWNLRQDSLDSQSPETLQFLADLLSK